MSTHDPRFYENPNDIPWFREAVEQSRAYIESLPENARPTNMRGYENE